LRAENVRLSRLLELRDLNTAPAPEQLSAAVAPPGLVGTSSPVADKLALFADRFRARTDVYAVRWDNARTGVSGWMPAVAGGWRKGMNRRKGAPLIRERHSPRTVSAGGRPSAARPRAVSCSRPPATGQLRQPAGLDRPWFEGVYAADRTIRSASERGRSWRAP
jgi:hypothetical protein